MNYIDLGAKRKDLGTKHKLYLIQKDNILVYSFLKVKKK